VGIFKRHKKVDPKEVGSTIAEIGSPVSSGLIEMLLDNAPEGSPGVAHSVLASLTLLACRRALEAGGLNFTPASVQAIWVSLVCSLAAERVRALGLPEGHSMESSLPALYDEMVNRADSMARIWDESLNKEPSPHWYVAKEGWFIICGDRSHPNPAMIVGLSGFMSTVTTTALEFMKESRGLVKDL
jgi:hypothetical protein